MASSTAAPGEAERLTGVANRRTEGKSLNRGVDPNKPGTAPAAPAAKRSPAWTSDRSKLAEADEFGLKPGKRYEFKDPTGRSSWVVVNDSGAQFIGSDGKRYL